MSSDLPALGNINEHLWVLDYASAGDYVILESISFMATTQITDAVTAAFVWSYGMLLNNWNPTTGLIRDKAKDASGEFDAIQATGSLAAATVIAEQLAVSCCPPLAHLRLIEYNTDSDSEGKCLYIVPTTTREDPVWEYQHIIRKLDEEKVPSEKELNSLGAEGWENEWERTT